MMAELNLDVGVGVDVPKVFESRDEKFWIERPFSMTSTNLHLLLFTSVSLGTGEARAFLPCLGLSS